MPWAIAFLPACQAEFDDFAPKVEDALLSLVVALRQREPGLGRPDADTLKGSAFADMKEIRFRADRCVWCVASAFDQHRHGILLVAGKKAGGSEHKFYQRIIAKADARFEQHLKHLDLKERS